MTSRFPPLRRETQKGWGDDQRLLTTGNPEYAADTALLEKAGITPLGPPAHDLALQSIAALRQRP
ncbi:MAG: hypothetical protein WBV82_26075 [Myxococcaceae bacterium]